MSEASCFLCLCWYSTPAYYFVFNESTQEAKNTELFLDYKTSKQWIFFQLSIDVTSLSAENLFNISKRLSQRLYF